MNDTCTCGHGIMDHRALLGTSEDPHVCFPSNELCICRKYQKTPFQQDAKPKLKMQLILLGESSLYVKVEEVDARFLSGKQYDTTVYRATDGFEIWSSSPGTSIRESGLHVYSGDVVKAENAENLGSGLSRKVWIERMEIALKEWSNNWEGFKTCSPSCTNHCPPQQPARVEKEERYLIPLLSGVTVTAGVRTDLTTDFKVIHYTVY